MYIYIYIHICYILEHYKQVGALEGIYSINFLGLALPGKVLHGCTGLNG